ncbi:MAG: hypothetical protein E5W04_22370 [Mesorhizobium sp.]|nr:MAG: hypothetical protein E5W04_22370 [Mesorhizobium sp.]
MRDVEAGFGENHLRRKRVEGEMRNPQDGATALFARRIEMLGAEQFGVGSPADEPLADDLDVVFAAHRVDTEPVLAAYYAKGGKVRLVINVAPRLRRPFQPLQPKADTAPSLLRQEKRDEYKNRKPQQESEIFQSKGFSGARGSLPFPNIDFQAGSPPLTPEPLPCCEAASKRRWMALGFQCIADC